MNKVKKSLAAIMVLLALNSQALAGELFQVSTGNALMEGLFQGGVSFKELREKGDFGLGSVEHMDGELIAIDGVYYRIDPEGHMHAIPDSETTPYAMVTTFKPTQSLQVENIQSLSELVTELNKVVTNRNVFYAVRLKGEFGNLKLRAVHKQKPPYPTFPEVASEQSIFNLKDTHGDAVGFFTPPFLSKLNVPGYHIHYITTDRKTGGHILEGSVKKATVEIMPIHRVTVALPDTSAFEHAKELNTDFTPTLVKNFGPGVQLK